MGKCSRYHGDGENWNRQNDGSQRNIAVL